MSNYHCQKCGKNFNNDQFMEERKIEQKRTDFMIQNVPMIQNGNFNNQNFPIVKTAPMGKIEPRFNEVNVFNGVKPGIQQINTYGTNENVIFAAILTKVEEDMQINSENKIYFTIGMSNSKHTYFQVLDNGSAFQFNISGLFRIVFTGNINVSGVLSFERKPQFNSNQEKFTRYKIAGGEITQSTMLPFKKGFILSVKFYPTNKSQKVIIKSGSQLEIYRVDNL